MSNPNVLHSRLNELKKLKKGAVLFTKREADCIKQGLENKNLAQIAKSLGLSNRSVYFYMAAIRKKLTLLMMQV